jgi:hypothetical protein
MTRKTNSGLALLALLALMGAGCGSNGLKALSPELKQEISDEIKADENLLESVDEADFDEDVLESEDDQDIEEIDDEMESVTSSDFDGKEMDEIDRD